MPAVPAQISAKAEYLKRYMSKEDASDFATTKKKRKKKVKPKAAKAGLKIIDDDYDWRNEQASVRLLEEDLAMGDEGPVVVANPKEMIDFNKTVAGREEKEQEEKEFDGIGATKFLDERHDGSGWATGVKKESKSRSRSRGRSRRMDTDSDNDEIPRRRRSPSSSSSSSSSPSPTRRLDSDDDNSPPRRKAQRHDSDNSPPRRKASSPPRQNDDQSPPRRRNAVKTEPTDSSPPRRRKGGDGDQSPPRRQKGGDGDISPPRRQKGGDGDLSPPRRQKGGDGDLSPPRRGVKKEEDLSPPRRKQQDLSPPRKAHALGLQHGREFARIAREEAEAKQRRLKEMAPEDSGANAETVIRDASGRKMTKKQLTEQEREKKKEKEEAPMPWAKGLAQQQAAVATAMELGRETATPFARGADDARMNQEMREQDRWGDPMANALRMKKLRAKQIRDKLDAEGGPQLKPEHERPVFQGDPFMNRFGVWPGHRWDGVERGNGYEERLFEFLNSRASYAEKAHKWSSADM